MPALASLRGPTRTSCHQTGVRGQLPTPTRAFANRFDPAHVLDGQNVLSAGVDSSQRVASCLSPRRVLRTFRKYVERAVVHRPVVVEANDFNSSQCDGLTTDISLVHHHKRRLVATD